MSHPLLKYDYAPNGEAIAEAEQALRAAGFSIGRPLTRRPRGLIFGDVEVKRWDQLSRREELDLHGQMWGGVHGEVTVMLHADAPPEATRAFFRLIAAAEARLGVEA